MAADRNANLGLAIGLSVGSGLCTSIGGLAVYVDVISKQQQSRILSSALALSAGVMLYVSFLEIFTKANDSLELVYEPGIALGITTVCFFSGMAITALLEVLVHRILHHTGAPHSHELVDPPAAVSGPSSAAGGRVHVSVQVDETSRPRTGPFAAAAVRTSHPMIHLTEGASGGPLDAALDHDHSHGHGHVHEGSEIEIKKAELHSTALMTALAIAIHNFPEGLATFVATLAQPSLGIALAVAIAVHNVPEGMAVAFPVYYTSGSKLKGFLWATLSGLTEPIGGCIGAQRTASRTRAPAAERSHSRDLAAGARHFGCLCILARAAKLAKLPCIETRRPGAAAAARSAHKDHSSPRCPPLFQPASTRLCRGRAPVPARLAGASRPLGRRWVWRCLCHGRRHDGARTPRRAAWARLPRGCAAVSCVGHARQLRRCGCDGRANRRASL